MYTEMDAQKFQIRKEGTGKFGKLNKIFFERSPDAS